MDRQIDRYIHIDIWEQAQLGGGYKAKYRLIVSYREAFGVIVEWHVIVVTVGSLAVVAGMVESTIRINSIGFDSVDR